MNKGGQVPGSGNTDTVPAMLTPGEVVMSKPAVDKIGADNLLALNAEGGGTNIPTVRSGYNEGGKVQAMSEKLGHTRGTVTDPKEKKQQENYMLHWVNKERTEVLGLPPLKSLTYADGVELTKKMGPGPKTTETSNTDMNFDTMTKSTWKTKSRGAETIFQGSMGVLTEEDKQAYLDSNPQARMAMELKDQAEMDALGADISASAKMKGGGLVQGFQGGGLVGYTNLGKTPMQQASELRDERREILRNQVDGKMNKEQRKRYKFITKKLNQLSDEMKADNKVPGYNKISTPTAPIVPETKNIKPIETKEVPSSMIAQPIITNIPGKTTNMPPPPPSGGEFGSEQFASINTRFQGSIDKLDAAYALNSYAALQ